MVATPGITSLVRLQGIRSAHTQPLPPAYTYIAPHFIALYSVDKSLHVCLINSANLMKRIINNGFSVSFILLFISQNQVCLREALTCKVLYALDKGLH